jgi:23S rRNA (uracil1939-C5)-methyltransferase
VQHLAAAPYADWKRGLVALALERARIETTLDALVDARGTGRRRVTLHVRVFGTGKAARAEAGFMEARSHTLIDLDRCPILVPSLVRAPLIARAIGEALKHKAKPLDVQATATLTGLDVDLRGSGALDRRERLAMTAVADANDLVRLTVHGELIVERRTPLIQMGKAQVSPPPGGFLQATTAGEEALAGLVRTALGPAKAVADLFCGVGPFTLRIAESARVMAFDSNEPSIAALKKAANTTQGLKPIVAQARDLFRRPLIAKELEGIDAVVFDPPRAGAEAQVRELAGSRIAKVVAVSCDPGTFTRDAALLITGGYRLERVTPVDQFVYSPHVELVGVFTR